MKLHIEAPAEPFLAGGTMPVRLVLANSGAAAFDAPSPEQDSPFDYTIKDGNGMTKSFSASARLARLLGGAVPPDGDRAKVAPGATIRYQDDLAMLLVEPLGPGDYSLEATTRTSAGLVRSGAVRLRLLPPHVQTVAHVLHAEGQKIFSVLIGGLRSGDVAIHGRESPRQQPALGVFRRFADEVADRTASSLSLAWEARPSPDWCWAVWAQKGKLAGGMARDSDLSYRFSDYDPGVSEFEILRGFQDDAGRATFVLAGRAAGSRALRVVQISEKGELKTVASGLSLPAAGDLRVSASLATGTMALTVFWVADGGQIMAATVDGSTGAVARPPALLHRTPGTVRAWEAPPVLDSPDAALSLVVAENSIPEGTVFSVILLHPTTSGIVAKHNLPPSKLAFNRWVLPQRAAIGMPVVARTDSQTMLARAGQARAWDPLELGPQASDLSVFTLASGESWIVFHAPGREVVYQPLP
jgi:hypothetical protein